jgi:hypothetical protein
MSLLNSVGETIDLGADRSSPSKGAARFPAREVRLASHHRPSDQAADAPTPDITRSEPECGNPARLQDAGLKATIGEARPVLMIWKSAQAAADDP